MKFKRHFASDSVSVNLVPLVDIIFQLLLFFMVAATFMSLPAITVGLPEAKTAEAADVASFTLSVTEKGLLLDGNEKTFDEISEFLRTFRLPKEERAAFPVNVEAKADSKTSGLITVMDALRFYGFATINLRTGEAE